MEFELPAINQKLKSLEVKANMFRIKYKIEYYEEELNERNHTDKRAGKAS
jgi:hypothetical protein